MYGVSIETVGYKLFIMAVPFISILPFRWARVHTRSNAISAATLIFRSVEGSSSTISGMWGCRPPAARTHVPIYSAEVDAPDVHQGK